MLMKSSVLLLSAVTLMTFSGCSGITAKQDNLATGVHNGQIYRTDRISLELVPIHQGIKIFPSIPLEKIKRMDGYYSYVIEKSNHSLRLRKKKNYILAEGDFIQNKTYRLHVMLFQDDLNENVTLNFDY